MVAILSFILPSEIGLLGLTLWETHTAALTVHICFKQTEHFPFVSGHFDLCLVKAQPGLCHGFGIQFCFGLYFALFKTIQDFVILRKPIVWIRDSAAVCVYFKCRFHLFFQLHFKLA